MATTLLSSVLWVFNFLSIGTQTELARAQDYSDTLKELATLRQNLKASQDQLNRTAEAIVAVVQAIPGAEDVYTPRNEGAQYYQLKVDRLAAGRLGVDVDALESSLRAQVEGVHVGTVYEGARRTPVLVRGPAGLRDSAAMFGALQLTLADGQSVPLASLVSLERTEGPVGIQRERGRSDSGRPRAVRGVSSCRDRHTPHERAAAEHRPGAH